MKKMILTLSVFLISSHAVFADIQIPREPIKPGAGGSSIGIPRGEKEQLLAIEVARLTGLSKYEEALKQCAINNKSEAQFFGELVRYFGSNEFKKLPAWKKGEEMFISRMEIKMLCGSYIEKAGIDL